MQEEYIAKQSVFYNFSILLFIFLFFFVLVIPGIIYLVIRIISANHYKITFYNDRCVMQQGTINTKENESVFKGVSSVTISQTGRGKIFNYGDVNVKISGEVYMHLRGIKNPKGLRDYLKTRQINVETITHVLTN